MTVYDIGAGKPPAGARLAAAIALATAIAVPSGGAQAIKVHVLHAFCAKAGCSDGASPVAPLLETADGTLYGTTTGGGDPGDGVAFALTPNGTGYDYTVLHSFCAGNGSCPDGGVPVSRLIMDANGNLYGTALDYGKNNGGTVFELIPDAQQGTWTVQTLYSFCAELGCADGRAPDTTLTYAGASDGLPYDGASPLFGTTMKGGHADVGVIYELTPVLGQGEWKEKVLHTFCIKANCRDGKVPTGVIADASGTLYGATAAGGIYTTSNGLVFTLDPGNKFHEKILYDFCPHSGCPDGETPQGPLALDGAGDLIGTTRGGGGEGNGVIFRLKPSGKETVIHSFCCGPKQSGVQIDATGNLYGVANGGKTKGGIAYRQSGRKFLQLHDFCRRGGVDCRDGQDPTSVVVDASGTVFGTTAAGGLHGQGIVFGMTP